LFFLLTLTYIEVGHPSINNANGGVSGLYEPPAWLD